MNKYKSGLEPRKMTVNELIEILKLKDGNKKISISLDGCATDLVCVLDTIFNNEDTIMIDGD